MPTDSPDARRTLGLAATTGVGVGAIVGGGILALAGVSFVTTGPSTILAFALNGIIALMTVASFAELGSRFPESGGTYTFARKALTVEAAFAVGWVVWFASVVAAVLYALGFAVFLVPVLQQAFALLGGEAPTWIGGRFALLVYALAAVMFYAWSLMRSPTGGGQWTTIGKLVVFGLLLLGGFLVLVSDLPSLPELVGRFSPFFEDGASGLAQAMGYTFIALQGFGLIVAVGGNVKDPGRNIPRAMALSVGTALAIYIPLLFLIVAVGTGGQSVVALAEENPEILVANAARNFLGAPGYWLVVLAGLLSMLSALQANVLAASSFAATMAADRTLPLRIEGLSPDGRTPAVAIKLTAGMIAFVLVAVPDVAAAGAVSSLIFLGVFALVHGIAYLVRKRAFQPSPYQSPFFPMVPWVGGGLCLALALYQAAAVPSAGVLAALWLAAGAVLFVTHLAPRARVVDARSEGFDPQLIRLRGRSPLILVPVANPENAGVLVKMAEAIAPKGVSRTQLLSVVRPPAKWEDGKLPTELVDAQGILGGALSAAIAVDLRPEALITLSDDPWAEITRIAQRSRPDAILLGIGELHQSIAAGPLERLIDRVSTDIVILRAPTDWDPDQAARILVPSRGGRAQSPIRARVLGSLTREARREVTFLGVLRESMDSSAVRASERELKALARDEARGSGTAVVLQRDDLVAEVVQRSRECDLMILGLRRSGRGRSVFGGPMLDIAMATSCPLLMISQRG
ncbi:MAG TPA: amino acid permease [Longimicrobiales bacterium]|nr:amino acid permease [Longimicrobiales bacterium]